MVVDALTIQIVLCIGMGVAFLGALISLFFTFKQRKNKGGKMDEEKKATPTGNSDKDASH